MNVYLPIAEMSVNWLAILAMGGGVGFLSGIFGVGGGFLMTPLLIFIGIPPTVAVGTQAAQLTAASVSGVIAHWRKQNVDIEMGGVLLLGGIAGSIAGVYLFRYLDSIGQIDLVIQFSYVVLLGAIGLLMLWESFRSMVKRRGAGTPSRRLHQHNWMHGLPWKRRFRRSKLYISVIPPFAIGFVIGVLAAIMGVGGGFIMIPAMIYILGMPTNIVIGTSLFQIIFVSANVTLFQAVLNQTVDIVLALILLIGSVVGAQFGSKFAGYLRGDQLRGLLAVLVLLVCLQLVVELAVEPGDPFTIEWVR